MKLLATIPLITALAGCTLGVDEKNVGDTTGGAGSAAPDRVFQTPRWALSLGSVGQDGAFGVAIDPAGDVIAGGIFHGSVDFGTQTLTTTAAGGQSWLSKRAGSDGSELWTVVLGTPAAGNATLTDVVSVPDGSIIVAGSYNGDLVIGDQTLHGPASVDELDTFVAKYDGSGHPVWAQGLDPTTSTQESSLAVGADGRIALVSTQTYPTNMNVGTLFLTVFGADGARAWQLATMNANISGAPSVVMTAEDDVVLSGALEEPITIDGTTLAPQAYWSAFAARFTLDGSLLWAREIGDGSNLDRPGPIAIGANNQVVLTSMLMPSPGPGDNGVSAVTGIDPTGASMWSTDAMGGDAPSGATVLSNGTIITAGDAADAGNTLAAYDASGASLDTASYNPVHDTVPLKLTSGNENAFAFAGEMGGALDYGTGPLRYAGDGDALIVMMDVAQP